ncbi:hypothetical protein BZL30_2357 [Mycobacterium kansasii]|uniref:Uncharacterized protein n=1 Tax=Mycobacterium kansasii TaxID=1768 RepID=A0A1V3XIQ7_MYCKA|nr:hypothetical protein BZL30_2357 [Mycobacterium kansasii]
MLIKHPRLERVAAQCDSRPAMNPPAGPGQRAALYTHGALCTCGRAQWGGFHRWPDPLVQFAPPAGLFG